MTKLAPAQLEVARCLFGLPEAEGFALAGGAALLAHGTIERPTRDIDAFAGAKAGPTPGDVRPLSRVLATRLSEDGWTVTVVRSHETFGRLIAAKDGEEVEIDLAVDSPRLFPTEVIDDIPMLAEPDLAARKVLAILDRSEGRDFTDLEALQATLGREQCVRWAKELDTGVTNEAIASSFSNLNRLDDSELPTTTPASTRSLYDQWRAELAGG